MKISKYLTDSDAIKSEKAIRNGIDNSMNAQELENAKTIATLVFDPIKDKFPDAGCYSFFRNDKVNKLVGGSPYSFHRFAGALDIDSPGNASNRDIFKYVLDENVPFNELIWEFGDLVKPDWVHVGYIKGNPQHLIKHIYYIGNKKQTDVLSLENARARFGFK